MMTDYPDLPDFLKLSREDRRKGWALWDTMKAHGLSPYERQLVRDVLAHHPSLTFDEAYQHLRAMGM